MIPCPAILFGDLRLLGQAAGGNSGVYHLNSVVITNMARILTIGLIGDENSGVRAHQAIPLALGMAARACGIELKYQWLNTAELSQNPPSRLESCNGFWCVPGSPYNDMMAALNAIKFARENQRPFLGTCGGFQHTLIEYARNVLGLADADHMESNASAQFPLIAPLTCSLVGASQVIRLKEGSRAAAIYKATETVESFHCNYGLNPRFESLLANGPLRVSGRDTVGEVRLVELQNHPFFVAALFQPELKALGGMLSPMIDVFVEVCRQRSKHNVCNSNSH
jgi:CTP synthase (UTP-ammonia lyase)